MAVENQFISVSNHSTDLASSWIYLVDWILVLILGIAFIFYFDRLLGFVLSQIAKILWRTSNVMINIESIRFSFLGGRLMIKNLVITTENQTVSILRLNLTWRYWLFRGIRLPAYIIDSNDNDKLPTKLFLSLEGLEIFMYNRTFAYDSIIDILNDNIEDINLKEASTSSSSDSSESVDTSKIQKRLQRLLRALPISVAIKKAVVILGNSSTPSLLINTCKSANGLIDIDKCENDADIYKQVLFFELEKFQVFLKPNITYQPSSDKPTLINHNSISKFKQIQNSLNKIPRVFSKLNKKKSALQANYQNWVGLKRYLGDLNEDFNNIFDTLPHHDEEYAKYSLILDTYSTKIKYYFDMPGNYTPNNMHTTPDYGCDLDFSMATIYYGPWADKQRVPIQNSFFPTLARDSNPTPGPKPGKARQYKGFKVTVVTDDEIIFRVPTREPSKDKEVLKSQNRAHTNINLSPVKQTRPFGWLELKLGPSSSVTLFTSFVASELEGWPNSISAIFMQPEMRSSVNHDVLYTADLHTIDAKVGFPLKWNGPCHWVFDNFSSNGRIFFLREHTLLFSDIFTDFGSGSPVPYENFRHFTYDVKWRLKDYKLYLNVNDSNIIDNPLDFDSNKYLSFQGEELNICMTIPLFGNFAKSTTVDFNLFAPCFDLILDVPPWHTANAFSRSSIPIGKAHNFSVDGLYQFLNNVEVNACNHIVIRAKSDDVTLKFFGSLVKYVFTIRENYMGDNFHFKTFEEYNNDIDTSKANSAGQSDQSSSETETLKDEFDYWKIVKAENNVDVLFSFQVRNGIMILPRDLYNCKTHIAISLDYFDTDIRFTNYYMDMQADFSPAYGKLVTIDAGDPDLTIFGTIKDYLNEFQIRKSSHLFIDEFSVHGHRMFGIPPTETVYCVNWRVASNAIIIDAFPNFIISLSQALSTFGSSFKDLENSLHAVIPTVYDALSFTFDCPTITIKLACPEKTFIIDFNELLMTFNDLANQRYSARLSVSVPSIELKVICNKTNNIHSLLKTSLTFENIVRKANFKEHRKKQQEHLRFNDAPTHRLPFLLSEDHRDLGYDEAYCSMIPPVSLPDVHYPINRVTKRVFNGRNASDESLGTSESYLDTVSTESLDHYENSDGLFIHPTINYLDEDFQPETHLDPKFKDDNMIFTFTDITGYLTPDAVLGFAELKALAMEPQLDLLMDMLEKDVVQNLKMLMLEVCTNDAFRVVAPVIDISFGEFQCDTEEKIIDYMKSNVYINLLIDEPSIAISEQISRTKLDSQEYIVETQVSTAISVKNVVIDMFCPNYSKVPVRLNVKDMEFWFSKDENGTAYSLTTEGIQLDIQQSQVTWMITYLHKILTKLEPAVATFQRSSKIDDRLQAALVYKLSCASSKFKIDHDPAVLTKPAYLIRSLQEHIRFFDSWMILVRLRHILNTVDEQWLIKEAKLLSENDWAIPDNAFDETWDVFSKWRSWEANYIQREAFFQQLFNIKPEFEKKVVGQVLVKLVSVNLSSGSTRDSINLGTINLSLHNRRKDTTFLKFNPSINDDFDASVSLAEILVDIGNIDSEISPCTWQIVPKLKEELDAILPKRTDVVINHKLTNEASSLILNIHQIDVNIVLESLGLSVGAQDFNVTSVSQKVEADTLTSIASHVSSFNLALNHNLNPVMSLTLEEVNFVSGGGSSPRGVILLDLFADNCSFKVLGTNMDKTVADAIKYDYKYVRMFQELNESGNTEPETPLDICALIEEYDATLNVQVNHLSWQLKSIEPFIIEGANYDNNLSFILADGVIDISLLLQKMDFTMKSNLSKSTLLEIENSQLFYNVKVGQNKGIPMVYIDSQFGFTKVFSPRLIKSINEIIDSYASINNQLQLLLKELKPLQTNKAPAKNKSAPSMFSFDTVLIDGKFTNDYIGVSFLSDRSKYSMELEDFEISLSNFGASEFQRTPFYGSLLIPACRVSIADRIIPIGLSNFVDVNVLVKILNEKKDTKGQLLEVVSQYCRVCLSAGTIERVVHLADELTIIGKRVEKELNIVPLKLSCASAKDKKPLLNISGVHFLSYHFCFGWIFENARNDYPGIIVGAERFYAVTDENIGKLSLMDAYLAVAHGVNSSGFYSSQSEKTRSNRAFLPFMQFIYMVNDNEDSKELKITITGDELDVNYLSNAFLIFEYVMQSVSKVQTFFNNRVRPMDKWVDDTKTREQQHDDYINSLRSTFSLIECRAKFAGSNVLIHRVNDTHSNEALFLHFPAVQTMTTYVHDKVEVKKHIVKCEVHTSSSENKLHSSCVPVLVDILEGIKKMISVQNQNSSLNHSVATDVPVESKPNNFGALLDQTDFHLGLRVDKQNLSFSCEPTAKVETLVGIEGISFQLNSGANSSINATASLQSITASLQHIYSREVSGSFGINDVIVTTNIDFANDGIQVRSASMISDVDGYINMKQYQDLELFKDIWYPQLNDSPVNEQANDDVAHEKSDLATMKNIAMRFKEVSTTNPIPWLVTFVLQNLALKVNLGPTLGEMMFQLDTFWLVSEKTLDWTQQLKAGINSFILSSEGRLGGKFFGNDLYAHTEITWKLEDGQVLDVPLILISTGIDRLSMKATFDYHVFALLNIEEFSIDIFNKKSEHMISKDHLFGSTQFKSFELYMTSFTAATVLDIYNALLRMTQETQVSYKEALHDSNRPKSQPIIKFQNSDILETVKKLETEFEVIAGLLLIQIYPSSFDDSKVLVIQLEESGAHFLQNEYNDGISNELHLKFNDLTVSLSVNTPILEQFVLDATVAEFTKYARKARGGNILLFPSFQIMMKSFQKYKSNLVEYLYKSTFGGAVDVRWNLGSVNFIREMYSIHSRSLASRTEFKRNLKKEQPIEFKQHMFEEIENKQVGVNLIEKDPIKANEELDQAINQTIDKVSKDSNYIYLPLAPPIIEAPQLKELGNATPPLEWFGLHRNTFPNVTHELGIVNLQKVIHQVESEYSRILGRA